MDFSKLTKDDILKMEPGRELDSLIAEKIMGWKVISFRHCWEMPNGKLRTREQTSYGSFSPSMDIEAAWEVVDKLESIYLEFEVYQGSAFSERQATFWQSIEPGTMWRATGKNAPEAICKAALLTILNKEAPHG